jgi:hypothetical protein
MSDLKLVAPDQPTALERRLLDAAASESPSAEQRLRVRQALGLTAVTAAPPVARAGRAATLGKAAIGSVIVASAILALVFGGARGKIMTRPASGAPAQTALVSAPPERQPQAPAVVEPVVSPLPPVEPTTDSNAATSSASASKPTPHSVSSVSKPVSSGEGASDLSEQLRLIDAARAAVAAGNSSAATQALGTYGSKFPHGSFGQEAAVLRIETTDLQGNHTQAAALARAFLASHPNSPHVSLVQRIADRAQ